MSLPLNANTQTIMISGPAGAIECAYDIPIDQVCKGVAIIAHPHPLYQGSMDNKVVHTIARTLLRLGYQTWRFNFRGVSQSAGQWDDGVGETDDMMAVIAHIQHQPELKELPLVLAGFSFGAYIAAKAANHCVLNNWPVQQLILVGTATNMYQVPSVPQETLVVHGEADELIPLQSARSWAQDQNLSLKVVPNAGHFFHGHLPELQEIILAHWRASIK